MPDKTLGIELINETIKYNILVSFSSPQKGITLLKLANSFIKSSREEANITMLHLSSSNELNQFNQELYERDNFEPIELEAKKLSTSITTVFKPSIHIDNDITQSANNGNFDLLLIGIGNSIYDGTILGKILGATTKIINPEKLYDTLTGKERLFETSIFDESTKNIIKASNIPVGIYVDKQNDHTDNVIIPLFSISDSFLLIYAKKLILNNNSFITILDPTGIIKQNPELKEAILALKNNKTSIINKEDIKESVFLQQDLMLLSVEAWKKCIENEIEWMPYTPSTLILKA